MAIKSDRWIREMSEKHGMIEPYAENQVRLDENGQKLISYGVSSYGYDVRCAREFKVFTNVHSAIVDPKNFDDKSFIDIEADVCIIPPITLYGPDAPPVAMLTNLLWSLSDACALVSV